METMDKKYVNPISVKETKKKLWQQSFLASISKDNTGKGTMDEADNEIDDINDVK